MPTKLIANIGTRAHAGDGDRRYLGEDAVRQVQLEGVPGEPSAVEERGEVDGPRAEALAADPAPEDRGGEARGEEPRDGGPGVEPGAVERRHVRQPGNPGVQGELLGSVPGCGSR